MSVKHKNILHPRNRHQGRYDFKNLIQICPELQKFVKLNAYDPELGETIDFSDPQAVKTLNKALLEFYYGVSKWSLPSGYLCPPVPGRADYIHYLADLLDSSLGREIRGKNVYVLDIGTGANCIYPLIGQSEYGWHFVGSDIDILSLKNAEKIVKSNEQLKNQIEFRLQKVKKNIFKGIINATDFFALTLCNPPFHRSVEEACAGSLRKWRNLKKGSKTKPVLNFGGQSNELWCQGGEKEFISKMIEESGIYKRQVLWFSTLVSKKENLDFLQTVLSKMKVEDKRIIEMSQGQKVSRILAWTFFSRSEQMKWKEKLI